MRHDFIANSFICTIRPLSACFENVAGVEALESQGIAKISCLEKTNI